MGAQTLIVFALVLGCSMYALWVLLPAVARQFLARHMLRLPLPLSTQQVFQRAAKASSGCDCSGCDKVVATKAHPTSPQVMRFHPRPKD